MIRFLDLYFSKTELVLREHAVYTTYMVGVAVKHLSRLALLQLVNFYRFRNENNTKLLAVSLFCRVSVTQPALSVH